MTPGRLAQVACVLEAVARKPGNVNRDRDFEDLHLVDFLLSAGAIAGPMDRAASRGVGRTVLAAVRATRAVVRTNTNLGMVLLLAPLAAVPPGRGLAEGVEEVLAGTTVDDARAVYRAIRLASPGGLGEVEEQDVAAEPDVDLRSAMRLAADRDLVALQYANGFRQVLGEGLPALRRALDLGRPLEEATIGVFLRLMADHPDSLIARKLGRAAAEEAGRRAGEVLSAGWPDRAAARGLLGGLDAWLRAEGHARNPGATADLVAAVLYAGLREGDVPLPRPPGARGWSVPAV